MVLSRSTEYAVRAAIFLAAQEAGSLVMAKEIADRTGVPSHFLAKLLQRLARRGVLRSSKGPSGGFGLARPANRVTLIEIMRALDEADDILRCPMGGGVCSGQEVCAMHSGWAAARGTMLTYLESTSLAQIVQASPPAKAAAAASDTTCG